MKCKPVQIVILLMLLGFQFVLVPAYAGDAEVLPKGVSRARVNSSFYFPVDERFNPDGDTEDVAVDYSTSLNSNVFSGLSAVETAFGMPAGSASIGNSEVDFEYDFTILNAAFEYGVTKKLTVGVMIPYWQVSNNVVAINNPTKATVGKSAIGTGLGAPLAPLPALGGPFPDTVPLTTDDVQNLLGPGLDTNGDGAIDIPGFGYKRIENRSNNALSDIEVGARYQYFKTEDWRLAFTGGVRLPTGEIDDPDDFVDYATSDGTYDLLFRFNNDYTGIKNLILNGTLKYDLQLPDKEVKRVPDDVNLPITTNKEKVDRDLGDIFEVEVSGKYTFMKGLSFSSLYKYGAKMKDDISGSKGFSYKSLEDETNYTEQVVVVGLSYTTLPLFLEKKFPLPLIASVSYRNRFAGTNNILKSEFIGIGLQAFFR